MAILEPLAAALTEGKTARTVEFSPEEMKTVRQLQLLTSKPVLYVCNVGEEDAAEGNHHSAAVFELAEREGASAILISAAIEAEIARAAHRRRQARVPRNPWLQETGLARLIRRGYGLLDLLTFFTAGPKEARAWTVRTGPQPRRRRPAPFHTDFERGFIRAETIAYDDFIACGGEAGAQGCGKAAGRRQGLRRQGRRHLPLPLQRLSGWFGASSAGTGCPSGTARRSRP